MWGHREAGHWQDERSLNKSSQVASRSRTLKYLEFPELWKINLCCLSPLVWCFIMVPLENGFSALQCVCSVAHSCLTLCDPMDYSLPGSSVHGIFQARMPRGLPFSTPGIFPTEGSNPRLLHLLLRQADSLPLHHLGSPQCSTMEDKQLLIQLAGDSEVSHSLWFSFSPSWLLCFPFCFMIILRSSRPQISIFRLDWFIEATAWSTRILLWTVGVKNVVRAKEKILARPYSPMSSPWSLIFLRSEMMFPSKFSWDTGNSSGFYRILMRICREVKLSAHSQTHFFPHVDVEGGWL